MDVHLQPGGLQHGPHAKCGGTVRVNANQARLRSHGTSARWAARAIEAPELDGCGQIHDEPVSITRFFRILLVPFQLFIYANTAASPSAERRWWTSHRDLERQVGTALGTRAAGAFGAVGLRTLHGSGGDRDAGS